MYGGAGGVKVSEEEKEKVRAAWELLNADDPKHLIDGRHQAARATKAASSTDYRAEFAARGLARSASSLDDPIRRAISWFPLFFLPGLHLVVRHAPARMQFASYAGCMGAYSLLSSYMLNSGQPD